MLRTIVGLTALVFLLVLFGYATSGAPIDPSTTNLGLTASAVHDAGGAWRLQFELRYTGETPLALLERSLPWKNPGDLLLVACKVSANGARLTPSDLRLRELPPTSVTVNPGDVLSGSVNLSARFPSLAAAIRAGDVVVFWSHEMKGADTQSLARMNGGVVIPRNS